MKEMLEKRKQIKNKKPEFVQQDSHKLNRLKKNWRRPRGSDSKMRLHLKGYKKNVEPGYGSPKAVKGMIEEGVLPMIISSIKDLTKVNDKYGAIISAKVGKKKKIEILKAAQEKKIKIFNIKDSAKYKEQVTTEISERKKKRTEKKKKTEEKKKAEEKKEEKKEDKLTEKVISEEEKSKSEKAEKDKIITKKGAL